MARSRLKPPPPSMVVALIALTVALSGTAIALQGRNTVNSGDIVNGAVKSQDVADSASIGGILGGAVRGIGASGASHGFAISPIGQSDGSGATLAPFVAPVDLTIRDLRVDTGSDMPPGASAGISITGSGRSASISCTVAAGHDSCYSGAKTLQVAKGQRIAGLVSVSGTFTKRIISFGYRLVP